MGGVLNMLAGLTHFVFRLLFALALSAPVGAFTLDKIPRPFAPDAQGNFRYTVNLNYGAVEQQPADDEPAALAPMDARIASDFRAWHKPKVRKLVRVLEYEYGIQAVNMTSWAMPTFTAFVSESTVRRLRGDPRVDAVLLVYEAADFSQTPPWSNFFDGGELVPYGKVAIGTNDAIGTGNIVYMIDACHPPAHADLVSIIQAPSFNACFPNGQSHTTHVAGILTAERNNAMVRGVNPHATVISVQRGLSDDEIKAALDWVLVDAESRRIHAVASISSNQTRWANGDASMIANYMRRLSNRLLVVQSAGNQHNDSCLVAYGPPKSKDGLVVVSAVDEIGAQPVPFDNSAAAQFGYANEAGANWGPCVEMWAPGQRVWSTWSIPPVNTLELSGTSMSAPHVSALAARYGSTSTTAVQRENYIRAKLRGTGWNDDHGAAILVPSYIQPASLAVASRLPIQAISADATMPGTSPLNVNDDLYLTDWTGTWNAGHAAPAWIEFDLGWSRSLRSIRLTPEQSPAGAVVHDVYAGDTPTPTTLVTTISGDAAALEPLSVDLNVTARYVRVHTTTSPSWVAWREVEIYGYLERARNDFNGDGYSDVLWRDVAGGQTYQWQMSGFAVVNQGYLPAVPVSWSAVGAGDFGGDGKADVLWRDNTDQSYMWMMDGMTITSQGYLPSVPQPWAIVGLGDANGDGRKDVFWRNPSSGANYLWIMDGLTIASQGYLPSVAGPDWEVVGVADHSGDAKADVLWRNKATGDNYLWVMDGLTVANQGYLPAVIPTDWEVVGSPDADGDGKADVLWRNKVTGDNYLWVMNGLTIASQGYVPAISDTAWKVVGWGDYDADGRGDVLWRNAATGANYLWLLNGIAVLSQSYLPSIVGANWQVVK